MIKESAPRHNRVNRGLLARPEQKALSWLAWRTPRIINSDHLTLLGLISMLMAGGSFWAASRYKPALLLVIVFLALNWLGDSLDGSLARHRNCLRPRYGYYVDHVTDLLGTAALFCGIALSGFMTPLIAVALLAAFAFTEAEVFLATHVREVFRLSCFGVGPTELRVVLGIGAVSLFYRPWIHLDRYGPVLLFDIGGIITIAGLMAAFIFAAMRNSFQLYREEPLQASSVATRVSASERVV